ISRGSAYTEVGVDQIPSHGGEGEPAPFFSPLVPVIGRHACPNRVPACPSGHSPSVYWPPLHRGCSATGLTRRTAAPCAWLTFPVPWQRRVTDAYQTLDHSATARNLPCPGRDPGHRHHDGPPVA